MGLINYADPNELCTREWRRGGCKNGCDFKMHI